MSLESSLQEIGAGLISSRANERKKNAESLKNFLTGNAVPSILTNNTTIKKGYNWNNVFDDIHEYILKELDKFEQSKTFCNVTAPLCTTLLHLCLSGSNKGQAYICSEKIMEACLYVLKDKRMANAIGDAYLQLLYKYVLPYEHYVSFITPATWEDLLDVSINSSLTNHTQLDSYTLLRLISSVIKKGANCSQFVVPLRNALPQLKKCFQRIECDKKNQETVAEITTILLEKLSSEGRLTMCEFTESILPLLLKCYDQNADQKKKASVFKLLHLIVLLHHPEGKLQGENGSLAHNWMVWNRYLNSIMEITCLEANHLQKLRKTVDSLNQYCEYYYSLAASVYFQTLNMHSQSADETVNSSKRQRVSFNSNKSFSDLIDELRKNHMPWLGIVYSYIQEYGQHVTAAEYVVLLDVAEALVSNNLCNWNSFEQLVCLILKNLVEAQGYDVKMTTQPLLALWNSCVRNSSSANGAHKAIHAIMQMLLQLNHYEFQTVLPLLKLYFEKGMPATDSSIKTLCCIYHKYYSKCSNVQDRKKCLDWFIQGNIGTLEVERVRDFLLRIIANENFSLKGDVPKKCNVDALYEILFHSKGKDILFSIGDLDINKEKPTSPNVSQPLEINVEMAEVVHEYLRSQMAGYVEKLNQHVIGPLEFIQYTRVAIAYIDVTLQISPVRQALIEEKELFYCLKAGLKTMCQALARILKESKDTRDKLNMLHCMQALWLTDYEPIVNTFVRSCADADFFASINEILSIQLSKDEDEAVYENDAEYNPSATKHNCIWLLAAYCRKSSDYRDDIYELILDPALYDFTSALDMRCAFRCIRILIDESVEECPLASVFALLSNMCRALFRISEATETILHILLDILDRVWTLDSNVRQNCFIMVKGYMQRCEKLYYPPHVAALIFKCVARMAELNNDNNDMDNTFRDALMNQMRGNSYMIRLYTCYLLDVITNDLSDNDIETYFAGLLDVFVISVSDTTELFMKDESKNRTLTVLHNFLAVAQAKNSSIHRVVTELLLIRKEKSLDASLVKTFLNKITRSVTCKDIKTYFSDNIVAVIHFWLSKGQKIEELPLEVLGYQTIDTFLEKHMKWVIAADILWNNQGDVNRSNFLNRMKVKLCKNEKSIIEMCFSNMIVLCLPYIVAEKYHLSFSGADQYAFMQSMKNANKMFKTTRQILDTDKWSCLFVETMPELLLLAAMHLRDPSAAAELFQARIPETANSYLYPKAVFNSILTYFGELIDGNIMQYLCSNQTITIFDILYELWENVVQTKVFEFRVLSLYTFITFVESVPLGFDSDAFVANFTCNSLTHAIKSSKIKDEIRVLTQALKIVLRRFLPQSVDLIRKSMLKVLSVLLIKKEEGFEKECAELLKYLTVDIKDSVKQNEDVVDFSNASHGAILSCVSTVEFSERLKAYSFTLTCPSHEALSKLRQFVKLNKHHVNNLCEELNTKHFSEECKTSVIHQVVYALTNIMKSSSDDKIIIEACNCLAEIGTYDLKTIVTVPPPDTKRVIHLAPKQSFAFAVAAILSEVLCDENPAATNRAVAALNDLFNYREGKDALELGDLNVQLLKPFLSLSNDSDSAVFKLSSRKLENCSEVGFWILKDKEDHIQWLARITTALLDILVSDSNYLNTLKNVCKIKPTISQHILPGLVGLLLHCSPETYVQIFSDQINNFFKCIWDMNFDDELDSSGGMCNGRLNVISHDRKMIIQYTIEIVNYVRLQRTHYKSRPDRTPVDALNYLRLDYDKVAWAASVADQNLVAIYYGELWAVARNGGVPPPSPERTTNLDGGDNIQRIFRKCFVSIGEMDAVDGCGTAHLTSEEEKRNHLITTGQYTDALLSHDIALCSGSPSNADLQLGVVRSLYKSGMHHLALQYIKSLPENDQINDIKYDCLTCLGDWNHFVDTVDLEEKSRVTTKTPLSLIKALRYACLRDCLNVQTEQNLGSKLILPLDRAKLAISRWCQNFNMENCQNVYRVVANLHLFSDIEDYFSVRCNKVTVTSLLNNWKVEKLPSFHDFKHLESLVSQRSLILEHAGKTYNTFLKDIVSLQLQYAEFTLSNGRLQMAQRQLSIAKNLQNCDAVSLVESRVAWAKGHRDIALSLIRLMGDRTDDIELNAASLRQYGMWMAESKFDNPRDIINKFLKKSLDVLGGSDHKRTRLKVYHDIAKFADSEYKQVVSYMNSSIFEHKLKCMESMKGAADSLRTTSTQQQLTKDERKYLMTTRELSNLDEADIANTKAEKQRFLQLAMRYYLLSLKHCEENNLSVFRVISLWLANPGLALDADGDSFEALLGALPSRKFLAALPQLAPRLAQDTGPFADNLLAILSKMCYSLANPGLALDADGDSFEVLLGALPSRKFLAALPQLAPRLAQDTGPFADNLLAILSKMCYSLANPGLALDADGDSFEVLLGALPSRKFLAALPQLAPRLAQDTGPFADNLLAILSKMCYSLANPGLALDADGDSFEVLLGALPSRKFLAALPQLAPRLAQDTGPFADNLLAILSKMCYSLANPGLALDADGDSFEVLLGALPSRKFLAALPQLAPRLAQDTGPFADNLLAILSKMCYSLANPGLALDADGDSFEALLGALPSRKFLAALPQLAPRLAQDTGPFADNLLAILSKMCYSLANPGLALDADGDSFEVLLGALPSRKFLAALPQLAPRLAQDTGPFADNLLAILSKMCYSLANPGLALDADGDSFEALLGALPSRKFLAALPQLAPRLAQDTGPFADNLLATLKRCAKEHPHHTLPILFSLKNSDKDMSVLNASRHAGELTPSEAEPRVGAAAALVAALAAETPALNTIVAQMERMCDATISFANYKTKEKTQKQKIPSAELIRNLGRLDAIPVPIDTIPIRHDCNYSYVPTIESFDDCFELVGGINCPKKINCLGSDGRKRIVLVKGEDDLRQDAVMQQVFNIVNTLLEKNPVTSRNKLLIRIYKVVPMSRQSGVLEWCEGTLPLGAYLVGTGSNGAHARYRPQDISCTAAREKFTSIQKGRRTLSEKLAIFMNILKNFKPVFHNFFTEQYLDPVTWYERRLAYTKSVATSSMVGYILGLGDRHVQNILIDKNTAEVVHIDFGIAFDQGKALPTPETIPFRLTQDMIAGFGSSGVEGIFRKSCEKTMQLLRDNHETLLTILEVLLCDPLYAWTTKKFKSTQKDLNVARPTGSVADLAERALLAVGSKLHGTEGGAAGGVAVPGQVARLIRSATDPANLCRLFQGWQPYL